MTSQNFVKISLNNGSSIEPVDFIQTGPQTIRAIFGGTSLFGGETMHDIIECAATKDGTAFKGRTKFWGIPENVSGLISDTSLVVDISGYKRVEGSIVAADSAALLKFVIACDFPPI